MIDIKSDMVLLTRVEYNKLNDQYGHIHTLFGVTFEDWRFVQEHIRRTTDMTVGEFVKHAKLNAKVFTR